MFCRNCGKELTDGSRFCKYCGSNLDSPKITPQAQPGIQRGWQQTSQPQPGAQQGQQPYQGWQQISQQQPVTQQGQQPYQGWQQTWQQPHQVIQQGRQQTNTPQRQDSPKPKKKKSGKGFVAAIIIIVIAAFGINRYMAFEQERSPVQPRIVPGGNGNDNGNEITISALDPTKGHDPELDMKADRIDALIEFADYLKESGDTEAAEAVYAMIPKAALRKAVDEEIDRIEESDSGGLKSYLLYKEMKKLYGSIYGKGEN